MLVCDRYSAYKSLAKGCDELILAFCWAHVRRDFLKAARSWPELERWMFTWVDDIRELYRLNAARLVVYLLTTDNSSGSSCGKMSLFHPCGGGPHHDIHPGVLPAPVGCFRVSLRDRPCQVARSRMVEKVG